MTPEQSEAVLALVHRPAEPAPDPTDLVRRTGRTDPTTWALLELQGAIGRRSADDVELAMVVAAVFGEDDRFVAPPTQLLETDQHVQHEDAASALDGLGAGSAVPALVHAAHHVPDYLDVDEARSPAVKAIRSLGRIPGDHAELALRQLLQHEDRSLRPRVQRVLDRRVAGAA